MKASPQGSVVLLGPTLLIADVDSFLNSQHLRDSFPVTNYKYIYQYKIGEKRLAKSTPLRIKIRAFNGYNGEELVTTDISPPALPLFTTEPKISTSNNAINIEISPIKILTLGQPIYILKDLSILGLLSLLLIIPITVAFRKFIAKSKSSNRENCERKTETIRNLLVKITEYPDYVKYSLRNGELVRQHKEILNTDMIYETIIDDILIDYLDTEYIDGQHVMKSHLSANVPEPDKFALFWKLIWKENIKHIIFLDNPCEDNQETAENYWHVKEEDLRPHKFSLTFKSCDSFSNYECRKFILTSKKTSRHIVLYRYCSWSNTSTLFSSLSLMHFFQTTSKIPLNSKSPILVQCSTGLEGTGFALLCDICLRTANRDGTVDIFTTSHRLAKCDQNLINNINYYLNILQITLSKNINLVHRDSKIFESYDWITVQITIGDKTKIIEIIVMKNWSSVATRPENVPDFVKFCNETNTILKNANSILVMSHKGIKDSGLYIAMLYNITKMEVEGVCDVPTSVRMVRNQSQDFGISERDFTFLLEATENYLKEAQLYEVI
ncbi:hypothetical protein MTP99_004921 [Tenebrio molitor]|nr:hypothetical protein MTP99_004921 [Tenebrio molitor]